MVRAPDKSSFSVSQSLGIPNYHICDRVSSNHLKLQGHTACGTSIDPVQAISCTLVRETITHGYTLTAYTGYPAALSVLRHTDMLR